MTKHKQPDIHVQEPCDEWLSTRNRKKITPPLPLPKRRSVPLRGYRKLPSSPSSSPWLLTQNSPPPPQLISSTKQSNLLNYFNSSKTNEDSELKQPCSGGKGTNNKNEDDHTERKISEPASPTPRTVFYMQNDFDCIPTSPAPSLSSQFTFLSQMKKSEQEGEVTLSSSSDVGAESEVDWLHHIGVTDTHADAASCFHYSPDKTNITCPILGDSTNKPKEISSDKTAFKPLNIEINKHDNSLPDTLSFSDITQTQQDFAEENSNDCHCLDSPDDTDCFPSDLGDATVHLLSCKRGRATVSTSFDVDLTPVFETQNLKMHYFNPKKRKCLEESELELEFTLTSE